MKKEIIDINKKRQEALERKIVIKDNISNDKIVDAPLERIEVQKALNDISMHLNNIKSQTNKQLNDIAGVVDDNSFKIQVIVRSLIKYNLVTSAELEEEADGFKKELEESIQNQKDVADLKAKEQQGRDKANIEASKENK